MQEQFCETRDEGIKWPQWHTLPLGGQVAVDMRVGWPEDVNKMLLKEARMVYWKRLAANHEYEDLKEGVWLELIQAMLRRTTNEFWTEEHRNMTRILVVEGGWVQKRLYDIGWDVSRILQRSHGKEQSVSLSIVHGSRKPDPSRTGETGAKGQNFEGQLELGKRNHGTPSE